MAPAEPVGVVSGLVETVLLVPIPGTAKNGDQAGSGGGGGASVLCLGVDSTNTNKCGGSA